MKDSTNKTKLHEITSQNTFLKHKSNWLISNIWSSFYSVLETSVLGANVGVNIGFMQTIKNTFLCITGFNLLP